MVSDIVINNSESGLRVSDKNEDRILRDMVANHPGMSCVTLLKQNSIRKNASVINFAAKVIDPP